MLAAHRRHGVPTLHEALQLTVERGLDRLHVGQQLLEDEAMLRLTGLHEVRRDPIIQAAGQLREAVDVDDEAVVVLVARPRKGVHRRDGTP